MSENSQGEFERAPRTSQSSTLTQCSSQDDANSIDAKLDRNGQYFIEVTVEKSIFGKIAQAKRGGGGKGFEKYILANGKMLSPQDFKAMGDKKNNKAWKKSIKHKGKPVGL